MPGHLPNPLLSLTYPLIDSLPLESNPDGTGDEALALHDLWTVFTRCKNELKDGKRLENIAWRLYSPSQASAHLSPQARTPSLSSAASTSASTASPVELGLHSDSIRLSRSQSGAKRTFGSVLNLVLAADQDEEWQRLRDWVGDAGVVPKQRERELSIPAVAVEDLDNDQGMGVGVRRDTPSESSRSLFTSPFTAQREPMSTPPLGSTATSLSTSPLSQPRQRQPSTTSSTASSLQTPYRLTASNSTSTSTTPHTGAGPAFQLRLVEPTPVPSRVGSLGTDLNNPSSSGPGSPALPMTLQPPIEEEEARVREKSTTDLTELVDRAKSMSPIKPASSTSNAAPIETNLKSKSSSVSPSKKKEKRMFFIQRSPGSAGTVGTGTSGGESETGGSSFGAVSPSAQFGPSCSSPLSPTQRERPIVANNKRQRSLSPMKRRQASLSPSKLGNVTSAPPPAPAAKSKRPSQTNLVANHGHGNTHHRRRSSGKPSGPVPAQAPAPIKRVVSAATMQGRFRGQKMAAAAAIQEKNAAAAAERKVLAKVQSIKNMQEETGGWEDEDGESDGSDQECEEDDEGWSDEGSEEERISKEEEKRRADEAERQRQREMFAKRQIFGPAAVTGGIRAHASAVNLQGSMTDSERPSTPGLLSGMFKCVAEDGDAPRRGGSMVDLKQTPHGGMQRRVTHNAPPKAGPALMRSKSAVAIPVQTGLSVGRDVGALQEEDDAPGPSPNDTKPSPDLPVKPKPPPDAEMEDSDASDYSPPANSFLATSEAQRRLCSLAAKRDACRKKAQPTSPDGQSARLEAPLRATTVNLLAPPQQVIAPQTPTTTRRNMIMNEMSESLRMNLIWERRTSQASLGPPKRSSSFATAARPLVSTVSSHSGQTSATCASPDSGLQSSASAHNLQQLARQACSNSISPNPQLGNGGQPLARQMSHPVHGSEISPPPVQRKRTQPNLLSGGGILRPLTRVGHTTSSGGNVTPPLQAETSPQLGPCQGSAVGQLARGSKSRSSADLTAMQASSPAGAAPPMVRSSTEGDRSSQPPRRGRSEVDLLKMQLRRREEETSMSYRSHGW